MDCHYKERGAAANVQPIRLGGSPKTEGRSSKEGDIRDGGQGCTGAADETSKGGRQDRKEAADKIAKGSGRDPNIWALI